MYIMTSTIFANKKLVINERNIGLLTVKLIKNMEISLEKDPGKTFLKRGAYLAAPGGCEVASYHQTTVFAW